MKNARPPEEDMVAHLVAQLKKLPGIGPRSAERIAFHILMTSTDEIMALAHAIRDIKKKLTPCKQCFNASETGLCSVCRDPARDQTLVCVVEQLRDLVALERASVYRGTYHVLLGALSPIEGIAEEDLTMDALVRRVSKENVKEVILATNPTMEGDNTALRLWELLEPTGVQVTRLARGIASGGQLGFASRSSLADALDDRRGFGA